MKKGYYVGLCALAMSSITCAGEMGAASSLPDGNFFLGIGGSYASAELNKQTIYGKGINNAFTGSTLSSSGSAAGTSIPFYDNEKLFAPHAQLGYLRHFKNSTNFWGAKFTYDYLNAHFAHNDMTIPQAGSNYRYTSQSTEDFIGNYVIESTQTSVNHQLLLLAFIGHSFDHCKAYFGVGPALFGMNSKIYRLVGHADYYVHGMDISGAPVNLSKTMWEWGGAGQLGVTYSLNPSWFLDINYTYALTARNTVKYISPFTNVIAGQNTVGTSYINPSQQIAVQAFSISINKLF
jgi:hypothetical protein